MDRRLKNGPSILASEQTLAGPLGMGHHAEHVAPRIRDSSDVSKRTIGVCLSGDASIRRAVAENDLLLALESIERFLISKEVSLTMRNRNAQDLSRPAINCEGRNIRLDAKVDPFAAELAGGVSQQGGWQQPGLLQNLKAVAAAQ